MKILRKLEGLLPPGVKVWLDEVVTTKRKHIVAVGLLTLGLFAGVLQQQSFRDGGARWDSCVASVDVRNDLRTLLASFADLSDVITDPRAASFVEAYKASKLAEMDRLYPALTVRERCGEKPHVLWFD